MAYRPLQFSGNQPDAFLILAVFPSLVIACGYWSLRLLPRCSRVCRVAFWALAILGALAAAFFWQVRPVTFPLLALPGKEIWEAVPLPVLVLSWVLYRACKRGKSASGPRVSPISMVRDCALAAAILVTIAAVAILGFHQYSCHAQAAGLKRWAEIGRPMEEFKKHLKPIEENDSLKALVADLRPYGIGNLYKEGTIKYSQLPANDMAHAERPEFASSDVIELVGSWNPPGDSVVMPAEKSAKLAGREGELRELYGKILSRPAPVWECHQSDGFGLAVPNFLLLRKMAQTIAVDAGLRLSHGDREGAANAIAAGLRVSESLKESPVLVSCMIRVAIEGLFAPLTARLPEEPEGWDRLEKEASSTRASFLDCIQAENLMVMNLAEGPEESLTPVVDEFSGLKPSNSTAFPRWLFRKFLTRSLIRLEFGHASMIEAGMVDYWTHRDMLASLDEGNRLANNLAERYPSISAANFSRGYARIQMMLLLREQAQMIRYSRAQMAAGKLGGEHPSVVLPGAKWEITSDPAAHTVSLKLTPTPPWAIKSDVADDKFLLLPLDGSKAWKFELP